MCTFFLFCLNIIIYIYIYIYIYIIHGPSLADAGPGARYEWGPLGPFAMALRGGGVFDSVRRGARGPVRPHQLHRPKDGPVYTYIHKILVTNKTK